MFAAFAGELNVTVIDWPELTVTSSFSSTRCLPFDLVTVQGICLPSGAKTEALENAGFVESPGRTNRRSLTLP